jgi:hypothetical protein
MGDVVKDGLRAITTAVALAAFRVGVMDAIVRI